MLLESPFEIPFSVLINEVHDELVFDMHPDTLDIDTDIIVKTMKAVPTLRRICPEFTVPLNVDIVVDNFWRSE